MKHSLFIALLLIAAVTHCRAQNKPELLNKFQVEKLLKENQETISRYNRGHLAELSPADRNILLSAIAKEVILIQGPDYYRDYQAPDIQLSNITDGMLPDKKRLNGVDYSGKPIYIVTFKYDTTKETLEWNYAAKVYILQESGCPLIVKFGNGLAYNFFKAPSQYRTVRSDVMHYQAVEPRKVHLNTKH